MTLLKEGTAELHQRIERVVPLLDPALDRPGYRRYLERLHGYLAPVEARLLSFAPGFARFDLDLAPRCKEPLLAADLVALGLAPEAIARLPRCGALPPLLSLDAAWGCLYVLEGSTLGGQVLARTLAPRLSLSREAGLALLGGYGERTGARWRELGEAVARYDAAGADRDQVVQGARDTFTHQMAWLEARLEGV